MAICIITSSFFEIAKLQVVSSLKSSAAALASVSDKLFSLGLGSQILSHEKKFNQKKEIFPMYDGTTAGSCKNFPLEYSLSKNLTTLFRI